ncbi:hypothetical protein ASZ90_018162 [hydrocarbon metagenome]|uniref:Uncharacterized protein n=1 Tax=hydrocarbon metagenome TaxID=938273 RepID=A0A0W8E6X2_9ZZZZ
MPELKKIAHTSPKRSGNPGNMVLNDNNPTEQYRSKDILQININVTTTRKDYTARDLAGLY